MNRRREFGSCEVETPQCRWVLPRDQYAPIRAAWLKGARFVDTVGFHGEAITLKLERVEGITDFAPECIASILDEKRADEADDSLAGGAV